MILAAYEGEAGGVCLVSFAPGVDKEAEARRVIPQGTPFWFVDSAYFSAEDAPRNEWALGEDITNKTPDGHGALR